MQKRSMTEAWGRRCLAALLATVLAGTAAWADGRLNDLRKRKVELDKMAANCATVEESKRGDCLEARRKKVDAYKADLETYKADLAKESRYQSGDGGSKDFKATIASRENSIREFTEYVRSCTEKSERCASALYQVANLTYQNEEDAFIMKQEAYEKEFQRWDDHDRKGAEPVSPRREHKASLGMFERFLKEYSAHGKAPEALVRAAFISDMQGNDDRAYEYLNLMVTRRPDHPLAVQAHLRLGEYWLLKRKYAKAIEHYEKVPLDYPGNEAGLALYHRAESYYNMASFEDAARWYYEYVVRADAGRIKSDLRDEAMSFMAAAWADLDNGFEVAEKFLRSKGNPAWSKDVYYEIGVKNKGHDRLDEAVKSFRFLMDRDPTYAKAPVADLSIVEILVLQKKGEEAQHARMDLVARYSDGSDWFRKNSGNTEAVEEAKKAVRLALYTIPVYYHQKGEEGKGDPDMLRKAEEGYRNYLDRYVGEMSWEVYQVRQNLAVLYGKLNEKRKAAQEWKWCAAADVNKMGKVPNDKKGMVTKQDAAFNAVVSMDEARKVALKENYRDDKAAAYRGDETRAYFETVAWFMGLYGTANAAAEIAYNAAILHYEAKQYDDAVTHLNDLITRFPNHEHAVLIRRALAQSLLENGKYEEAEKQFIVLQKRLCPSDKQCADIKKSLASTLFKEADARKQGRDYAGASQKYQQLVHDFRDVEIADKALYEAGVNADSAGKTEEGVALLLRIPRDYPKSGLRIKAVLKAASIYMNREKFKDAAETFLAMQRNFPTDSLAVEAIAWAADAYEKAGDLHRAAQAYESSYRLYPRHEKTPGYLYNSGQDYENAGEFGDAISVYRLLGENYPSSQYSLEALFSVPLLFEKKRDFAKAAIAYENFAGKYESDKEKLIRAHLGAGRNFESLGNEKKAQEHYAACVTAQKKDGAAGVVPPAMAAEAAYRAGDIFYRKINAIRLDGTRKQNAQKIKGMQESLLPSIQNYAKAVEMAEEEWALRATMRMGDLFYTIASISDNERVAGLSGDDRITAKIESKAGVPTYLDKAKEIYKKNLDVGLAQGIESPWIDTTGIRFMETYAFKGRTLEELVKLFLDVPMPKGITAEEKTEVREQLKLASEDNKNKALENYREALNAAQTYYLNNDARERIVSRLREMDPNAGELQLQVPPRPKSARESPAGGTP